MITPTVGRVMWYRPGEQLGALVQHDAAQPMVAHVCYVWNDNLVNLLVIDHAGVRHARTSVPVVQGGSPYTAGPSPYCEWMPYQKGQAAKAEALEAKLGADA
ncbi:MAG: hypothetical protein IT481_08685 [Gammaproteobacteria bacterium]|nr:hypothetical protein [Gammaproteobacteria bacterium]